ncbi:lytic transglycosylase domain-containing protein [Erwinia sp. V71]|uniref:lytic transglycosylase domain-containing protein n=1 Tax=Erwinia sp. V71 TaxID=3369424 RepID=UPI003F62B186
MIIEELAYKVTIKADEFLNGKRKIGTEVAKLENEVGRSSKNINRSLGTMTGEVTQFGKAAVSSFRGVTVAAAGFLGIGAGLYGIKQLFSSTANEIVRASQQAKFFGSDVNKVFGVRRGFQQAGLNGDAFISAAGNARMALANIADPTIFGGLTGAAQNLMVLGARTGLNINNLGDPNKALGEFTRYGKSHSQENLMQVLSAAGFDPSDAAKIKSGELKSLVDSETKKSNITAQQVKEQEELLVTLGKLDAEFARIRTDLAMAFAPEVITAMKAFGDWIKEHHGDIIGFFKDAGETMKKFTDAVGGANALLLLLALGLRSNPLVMAAVAVGAVGKWSEEREAEAKKAGIDVGSILNYNKSASVGGNMYTNGAPDPAMNAAASGDKFWSWISSLFISNANAGSLHHSLNDLGQSQLDGLLNAVMMTESGGNPLAYNTASGATGAYQFMPDTARDMGLRVDSEVDERLDPGKSRAAASIYMRQLLKRYGGNVDNALRAYNWGMGNVDKWIANGSDINDLPKETRDYTGKVYGNMSGTRGYYNTQGRLANSMPYQMQSASGNQTTNSTHINTVNVNSNPQTVDALTESIKRQSHRSSTNASFFSGVR